MKYHPFFKKKKKDLGDLFVKGLRQWFSNFYLHLKNHLRSLVKIQIPRTFLKDSNLVDLGWGTYSRQFIIQVIHRSHFEKQGTKIC